MDGPEGCSAFTDGDVDHALLSTSDDGQLEHVPGLGSDEGRLEARLVYHVRSEEHTSELQSH